MAIPKHEYFPTKSGFTTAKGSSTVFDNSVCFIEDSMEIYTHGKYWGVGNLSQYYNSATQKLQLKNGSTVISELDASPFIKDGMLESVELITTSEGSSAVLSVNGTNYPIVELDADTFQVEDWTDSYDTDHRVYILPILDSNKAYIVRNTVEVIDNYVGTKEFAFASAGTYIVKFDTPTYNGTSQDSIVTITSSNDESQEEESKSVSSFPIDVNQWSSIPATSYFYTRSDVEYGYNTSIKYYGLESTIYNGVNVTEIPAIQNATETTSSASNSNYPQVPYLKFTFNTFDGEPTHTIIRVSIAELFTVYNGDNVLLSSTYAKAQTYTEPAIGDKVDIAVGKLAKGISDNATAIATKQATITGAATTITSDNLTASKALVSDANGKVAASSVTSTELGYLSGVTSSIQTQLNAKANIADLGWVEH